MPRYDYYCTKCDTVIEIIHSIKSKKSIKCKECNTKLERQIGTGYYIVTRGLKPDLATQKEREHKKKVKDFDRAVKMRKKAFGHDAVGDPVDKPDPRHVIKRGRYKGGGEVEVDRSEFIKAAARDNYTVKKAQDALKKARSKNEP